MSEAQHNCEALLQETLEELQLQIDILTDAYCRVKDRETVSVDCAVFANVATALHDAAKLLEATSVECKNAKRPHLTLVK